MRHRTKWADVAREVGGGRSDGSCRKRWLSAEFQSWLESRGVELDEEERAMVVSYRASQQANGAQQNGPALGPWTNDEVRARCRQPLTHSLTHPFAVQDDDLLAAWRKVRGGRWAAMATELRAATGSQRGANACKFRWMSRPFQSLIGESGVELSLEEQTKLEAYRGMQERNNQKRRARQQD